MNNVENSNGVRVLNRSLRNSPFLFNGSNNIIQIDTQMLNVRNKILIFLKSLSNTLFLSCLITNNFTFYLGFLFNKITFLF